MAATSVKLTHKGKGRLDRLQAKLTLLGYKFTKEQVLEFALEAASESPGDIIARSQGVRYPFPGSEKVYREIVGSAEDWGPTSWRDIDRLLYGGKLKR